MTSTARPDTARLRLLLLLPGGIALLAGLDAALMLLGVGAPVPVARLAQVHGPLMVFGFVGTVIALERAVALGARWGYLAPAAFGLGGLASIAPLPRTAGAALFVVGAAALVAVYVPLWRRNAATAVLVQAAGAVLAVNDAVLHLAEVPIPWLLPWLVGFLVLTIAGERLELSRVALLNARVEYTAVGAAAAVLLAVPTTLLWPTAGYPLLGASLLALTGWLLRHDIARRTVKTAGLPRFSAACLLAGYAWLLVAGATWLLIGPVRSGPGYDAVAHAVFLGFVMSMIMAHAPIILPAVLRRPLPYHPVMYAPAVLLHASLLLRIAVGDLRDVAWAYRLGGVLNVVSVLGFVAVAAWSVIRAARESAPTREGVDA